MEDPESSQVMGPQFGYVDKFIGKDFMFWKFKMEVVLKAKDLWGFIDEKEIKPKVIIVVVLVAYKKKENRALNLIVQSLSNNQLFIV
jgi:hypothetical protein